MARQTTTFVLGLLALCAGAAIVLYALRLGFYIEATPRAIADSAKGHRIAVPAVVAVLAGVVALAGRLRAWGLVLACVGAAAAVVAVSMAVLIPSG